MLRSDNASEERSRQQLSVRETPGDSTANVRAQDKNEQPADAARKASGDEEESSLARIETDLADPESFSWAKEALYGELLTTAGAEEADFILALSEMEDWEEMKAAINDRGGANGDLLMRHGLRSGQISADEITNLSRSGVEIPPGAILNLVGKLPIDEILSMRDSGVPIDLTYQNPFSGKNALGQFIVQVASAPAEYDSGEISSTLRQLIDAGVEFSPQGVGQTPLDYALKRVTEENAEQQLAIVEILLERGAVLEERHRSLIENMPNGSRKEEFSSLL